MRRQRVMMLAGLLAMAFSIVVPSTQAFAANPPTIGGISPTTVTAAGGDSVVITGTGFTADATVTVGGNAATATVVSDTEIDIVAPASLYSGATSVTVSQTSGSVTNASGITYTPILTGITPTSGSQMGGTKVTLSGAGLYGKRAYQFDQAPGSFSASSTHACAIDSGQVFCWGNGAHGALGNGGTANSSTPVPVNGLLTGKKIVAVSTGISFSAALDSDGIVYTWGYNNQGQLGNNNTTDSSIPVAVDTSGVLAGKKVTSIASGDGHTMAIANDNKLYGWGDSGNYQLGKGGALPRVDSLTPTAAIIGILATQTVSQVAAAGQYSSVITTAGNVYWWGEIYNGSLNIIETPVQVGNATNMKRIIAGTSAPTQAVMFGINTSNQLYAWGYNQQGQLGTGTYSSVANATLVAAPINGKQVVDAAFSGIASSGYATAVTTDGLLYSWGQPPTGASFGNGTTGGLSNKPLSVTMTGALSGVTVTDIEGGNTRMFAKGTNGTIYGWGQDANTAGIGTTTPAAAAFGTAPLPLKPDSILSGGTPVNGIDSQTPTSITYTAPAHAAGTVDVSLAYPGYGTLTLAGAYTYLPNPTITAVSPNSGDVSGGDTVTINGTGFETGATVTFGSTPATNVTYIDSTQLSVTVPAAVSAGVVTVTVTNPSNGQAVLNNAYTYTHPAPVLAGLNIAQGVTAGGQTVVITGNNFYTDATSGVSEVLFDNVPATNITVLSTTMLQVTVPAHAAGAVDVVAKTPSATSNTLTGAYHYVPDAYVFSNSPLNIMANQPGMMTLTMQDGAGNTITSTEDITITLSTSSSGSFAASADGPWTMTTVTIPAGQSTVNFYYRDPAKGTPTVTATGPASVKTTQQQTITSKYRLLVTGVTDPVNAGTPSSVTVQATDWQGIPVEDYTGTIHFSSSDGLAVLPADVTITAGMNGRTTVINGVTMVSTGEQSVSATDTSDSSITGSQNSISVTNGYAGTATKLVVITDPQNTPANTPTNAITIQIQDADGNPTPLPVARTIYVSSSSATRSFSADGINGWTSTQPFAITIPAGASSTNVFYKDSANGTKTLTFADQASGADTGLTDTTQSVRIGAGAASKLALSLSSALSYGSWHPVTVSLKDMNDLDANNASGAPLPVYLSTDTSTALLSATSDGTGAATTFTGSIPAGANKLTLYIKDTAIEAVHVTASDAKPADGATGLADASATANFFAAAASTLTINTAQPSVAVDTPVAVTIDAFDAIGQPALVANDTTITLTDASASGSFSLDATNWMPIGSVVFPGGTHSLTLYYKNTQAGTVNLTADSNLGSTTTPLTVLAGSYGRLGITGPTTVPVNLTNSYTVTAYDVFGNVVTMDADTPVYVYSSSGSGSFGDLSGNENANSITIPSGASSATFHYKNTALSTTDTITLSDHTPLDNPDTDIVNATLAVTVTGNAIHHLSYLSAPQTIVAGDSSGKITVQAQNADGTPAIQDTDVIVSLSSDSLGSWDFTATSDQEATRITSVTIPAGNSQADFYYRDTMAGTHNLSATASGKTVSQVITVTNAPLTTLQITSAPQTKQANSPSDQFRVQLSDQYGNTGTNNSNLIVQLSSDCTDGSFSLSGTAWDPITTITIPNGQDSAYFYFKTALPLCTVSISSLGLTGDSQDYRTIGGPTQLALTEAPSQLDAGQSGSYTVTLHDVDGNVTTAPSNITVYLESDLGSLSQTTLMIPAGSSQGSFTLSSPTTGTAHIRVADQAGTTDTGIGDTSATTTIVAGSPAAITLEPGVANGLVNTSQAYTVRLTNNYGIATTSGNDTVVTLSSNNVTGVFTPTASTTDTPITSVTIPASNSTATVYYHQTTTSTATLTAASDPLGPGTATIDVLANAPYRFQFIGTVPTDADAGESVTYTVQAFDDMGNVVTLPAGYSIFLDSTGNGTFSGSNYNSSTHALTASNDTTTFQFTYSQTNLGSVTITAADAYPVDNPDSNVINASTPLTISYGAPGRLSLTPSSSTLVRGEISDIMTVTLQNRFGVTMPAPADLTVQLTSNPSSGQFATSNTGPWSVTSIMIPASSQSSTFYYRDTTDAIQPHTITASSPGLTPGTGNITLEGGTPASLQLTSASQTLPTSHTSAGITIQALNAYGYPTTMPSSTTLSLQSDESTGQFSGQLPQWGTSDVTWLAGDSMRTVYYRGFTPGTYTLSFSAPGLTPVTQPITIIPQTIDHLRVTNITSPQPANTPNSVVVTAQDAENYTVNNYTGTVHFTTSDPLGIVPADYAFKLSDQGRRTFTNGVVFCSAGTHTVTATDGTGITGKQANIVVSNNCGDSTETPPDGTQTPGSPTAQTPDRLYVTNISSPQQTNSPSSVVVIAQDAAGHIMTGYRGTVRFTTTDPRGIVPKPYTFVLGDYGLHTFINGVVFCTPGTHTVTTTDDSGVIGKQTDIVVTSGSACPVTDDPGAVDQQPIQPSAGTNTKPGGGTPTSPTDSSKSDSHLSIFGVPITLPLQPVQDAMRSVGQAVRSAVASPVAPYVLPAIFYLIPLILAVALLRSMYREIHNIRVLRVIAKREKQTAADKTHFLNLVAHHIRTPITVITSAASLIQSSLQDQTLVRRLETVAATLTRSADDIVTFVTKRANDGEQGEVPAARFSVIAGIMSPLFWVPVAASVLGTLLINYLIQSVGRQDLHATAILFQVIMIGAVATLLYVSLRARTLRKHQAEALKTLLVHRQTLDDAKNEFVYATSMQLGEQLQELSDLSQPLQEAAPQYVHLYNDGVTRLQSLVTTLRTLGSIESTTVHAERFAYRDLLQSVLAKYDDAMTAKKLHVDIRGAENIELAQDKTLLGRVATTILDNAIAFSPEGAQLAINTRPMNNELVMDITDHGPGLPEGVSTDLLTPFAHPGDELTETHQGLGLSLYLNMLIMRHLGGDMRLDSSRDGTTVTLRLPLTASTLK